MKFERGDFRTFRQTRVFLLNAAAENHFARQLIGADDFKLRAHRPVGRDAYRSARATDGSGGAERRRMVPAVADFAVKPEFVLSAEPASRTPVGHRKGAVLRNIEADQFVLRAQPAA